MTTTATNSVYDSARLAESYAYSRPPVHRGVIEKLGERLQRTSRFGRALDIGCGAGLSTAAIEPLAEFVMGLEPVPTMLRHRRAVTTSAHFAAGKAEQLPVAAGSFDLITAAGSLNYADLDLFFPEAARVLTSDGVLAIYDFSVGRRLRNDHRLESWFVAFEQRYPSPPGYEQDMRTIDYPRYGLQLDSYDTIEVAVPMTLSSYLQYALSEINVEVAVSRGVPELEIRDWCNDTLAEIFDETARDVLFDAYIACVQRG